MQVIVPLYDIVERIHKLQKISVLLQLIRQADGDNPITVRGRMIVKQTTENEKKLSRTDLQKNQKGCV